VGCLAVALGLFLIAIGAMLTLTGMGAVLGVPIGVVGLLILIWGFARMVRAQRQ
jgi:uncharacterized membrane protein